MIYARLRESPNGSKSSDNPSARASLPCSFAYASSCFSCFSCFSCVTSSHSPSHELSSSRSRARIPPCVSAILAPLSRSIYSIRSAGKSGAIGRYTPPALSTASSDTIIPADRSMIRATITSGPTPPWRSLRANRFARSFSSL
ncbi:hypothetical protein D3C81_1479680 [compost metagenome]